VSIFRAPLSSPPALTLVLAKSGASSAPLQGRDIFEAIERDWLKSQSVVLMFHRGFFVVDALGLDKREVTEVSYVPASRKYLDLRLTRLASGSLPGYKRFQECCFLSDFHARSS
jgi:hypothetical protein